MFGVAEYLAASVIDEDDVHLATGTRSAELTGIDGGLLSGSATCQQALEDGKRGEVGNEFLDSHRYYMQTRDACGHVGIAFVGTHDDIACGSHSEVGSCHTCSGFHKLTAEVHACDVGEERRVVLVVRLGGYCGIAFGYLIVVGNLTAETVADIFAVDMKGCLLYTSDAADE